MAKMDLASKSWCEMVFANRNQAYGAYQLRAELGKRNQIALIVVLALIVIGLLVPLFLKFVIPQKKDDTITEVTNFSHLKEAEVKDQHIKKVQPNTAISRASAVLIHSSRLSCCARRYSPSTICQ